MHRFQAIQVKTSSYSSKRRSLLLLERKSISRNIAESPSALAVGVQHYARCACRFAVLSSLIAASMCASPGSKTVDGCGGDGDAHPAASGSATAAAAACCERRERRLAAA
eukprot:2178749-Pleurochrysis_carterae.AAC.4